MPTYDKKAFEKYKQDKERPAHKTKRPFPKGAKSKGSMTCLEKRKKKRQDFFWNIF